jgi:CRISPR-associated endoribonuclease Cas6
MKIHYKSFVLSIKAKEPLILPAYKGSTFRGGFGNVFKKIVCALKKKDCLDCLLKERCIYCYIFETPPPSDTKIMRKYKTTPHPFVIEPPLERKSIYKPDEQLSFELTLIGKAIDYYPYFIYTFDELGKTGIGKGRGTFELHEVTTSEEIIYTSKNKKLATVQPVELLLALPDSFDSSLSTNNDILSLSFITPTRISFDGHLSIDIEFHMLIRTLIRRIAILSYFHCGGDPTQWDFKGIIEMAKRVRTKDSSLSWYDWERYSAQQDTRMKMGGFIGDITFEGGIEPFMPLIKAGEILHVGKGTSFGLGKFQIQR